MSPIPKGKEDLYGKVIGHMLNLGKSKAESKSIAEQAVGINDKVDAGHEKRKGTFPKKHRKKKWGGY